MKHLGRKFFHLFGGLGLLAVYFIFQRERALLIYGALLLVVLAAEIVRLTFPPLNRFIYARFPGVIRTTEERRLSGIVPYILGVGLSLYAYSLPAASAAVCFLAFGDVAATTVGERFGRTKIGGKSLEGTAAFIIAAGAAGGLVSNFFIGFSFWIVILGAVAAAVVELLPLPVNDNFAIPILSGAAMESALRWLG
ncbi:MAG TPA: hypothetical protein VK654_17095 [Nitrospirota bacterium]|nr:hypothetical protein [Nitrospirota bacterium]